MLFFKVVGVLSGLFGIMFLLTPKILRKIGSMINKVLVDTDSKALNMRIGIGISLCAVSVTMFFIAYYMAQKYGVR